MSDPPAAAQERRLRPDRRESAGRRTTDTEGRFALVPALWAIVGAFVVLYLALLVIGNFRPGEAPVASAVALGLAVLWLGHSWRRVFVGSRSPAADRERRGF